jgi:hypothetical protein
VIFTRRSFQPIGGNKDAFSEAGTVSYNQGMIA